VPFAIALIGEQLVPLFETLPTPEQLRLVVNRVIELAATRGVGVAQEATQGQTAQAPEPELEPEEEEAINAIEAGDFIGARASYQRWLNRTPGNQMASLGLAQVELLMRIRGLDSAEIYAASEANPSDLLLATQAADFDIAAGNYEGGFARLISFVRGASGDEKRKAREHLVALFALVDPADPVLAKARSALASALF
jgi:putative thioredoxin